MKKITVISNTNSTGLTMKNNLLFYFKDYIEVDCIILSEISDYNFNSSSLILASGNYQNVKDKLNSTNLQNKPVIIAERFINYKNIEELFSIPKDTKVLLVNDHKATAIETKKQLETIGFDVLEYDIYYPGKSSFTPRNIVITPGEVNYIPYSPKIVIDIGSRNLSIATLFEVIRTLDLPYEKNAEIMNLFLKDIVYLSRHLLFEENKIKLLNDSLIQIIEKIDYGIAYMDENLKIVSCNNMFAYYLGDKKSSILGKKISNYISEENLYSNNINELDISSPTGIFTIKKDYSLIDDKGYILTIKKSNKKNNHKIKNLYSFSDYITRDKVELSMLNNAKNFSRSEACVLIQGESGTGKEILAQAIHNNSVRKDKPFIPINITTISDSLIESELFGYEKGSFTGGLIEGKKGIFELANGGTIFIDEIGDAPPNIQVQLLRVIEESSIRKVGSHEEMPINVRIIAATNKNLFRETQIGKFRLDLYFRLNILSLNTIPLRNKREDIPFLLEFFLSRKFEHIKVEDFFDKSTIGYLENYSWPGNIRELNNLVEYLFITKPKNKVYIEDLPPYILENGKENIPDITVTNNELIVLQLFYDELKIIGRVKASKLLKEKNIEISVGKIKGILEKLNKKNLLHYVKNKGYVISAQGKIFISEYGEHIY